MCDKKCKNCTCKKEEPKMITIEEGKYLFAKEMYQHYSELFTTAVNELKFKSMNVQHLLSILEEVLVLLSQNRPHLMIAKIIDNGVERYNMDINIHNASIADWQYSFADFTPSIEDEEDGEQENMSDFNDVKIDEDNNDENYNNDWYIELLNSVKKLVDHYIKSKDEDIQD